MPKKFQIESFCAAMRLGVPVTRELFDLVAAAARRGIEADRLRAETAEANLRVANSNHEEFERKYYLELDAKKKAEAALAEATRRGTALAETLSNSLLTLGWVQDHPDFGQFANCIHEAVTDAIQALEREIEAIRARNDQPADAAAQRKGEK